MNFNIFFYSLLALPVLYGAFESIWNSFNFGPYTTFLGLGLAGYIPAVIMLLRRTRGDMPSQKMAKLTFLPLISAVFTAAIWPVIGVIFGLIKDLEGFFGVLLLVCFAVLIHGVVFVALFWVLYLVASKLVTWQT